MTVADAIVGSWILGIEKVCLVALKQEREKDYCLVQKKNKLCSYC